MCGIFGIVFGEDNPELGKILTEAGKKLVYRGYDSVGCAVVSGGNIDLRKDAGMIEEVSEANSFHEMRGSRGIIQLRWATFGRPSRKNAQPHLDCDGDMVGAHNGNIVNTNHLRDKYITEGHRVRGWNDGEIVVHTVEKHYDSNGGDMKKAIISAEKDLKGDYAYLITTKYSNEMYGVKKGSSFYMGVGDGFICCSSDLPSILPLTRMVVKLNDGEAVRFTHDKYEVFSIYDGTPIEKEVEECTLSPSAAEKEGYPHFMLKEINEQPSKAGVLISTLEDSEFVDKFISAMNSGPVYLVGSGSSYNACVIGAYYLNSIAHVNAIPAIAGGFIDLHGATLERNTPVVLVSQSGETKDVINVLNYCRNTGRGRILGILNVLGSTLMLNSDVYLPLACDLEMSVPATKTMLNQTIMFLYLAVRIARERGTIDDLTINRLEEELRELPNKIRETIELTEPVVKNIARDFEKRNVNDLYCLGYGFTYGTALEGALKIKEITYTHCEGMYSSEFKHGPLARVDKGYPIIFPAMAEDAGMVISHMNEILCRKGEVITIAPESPELRKNSTVFVPLPPSHDYMVPVLALIPLQLLAYHWSVQRGIDPDLPRNLSKTLTVD